jgi:hypothetical protein
MTATTKTPLGASTTNRKWYMDIDANDGVGTASWLPVLGIVNFVPNADNANLEDDSDFDSSGFQSQTKTASGWSATATVARKSTAADQTAYDPGQEHLRAKAIGKFGPANRVYVRFYEMEPSGPRVEAYYGAAAVSWQEQGGAETALSTVQVTLTGQGQLAQIAHPDTGSAVPTISALQFSGSVTATTIPAAGGTAVRLTGNHFTGTTGITFIGTSAPNFIVASDGTIAVTAPAHAAGSGTLVVTNGAGASTGYPIAYV